jgi:hypothetical protein
MLNHISTKLSYAKENVVHSEYKFIKLTCLKFEETNSTKMQPYRNERSNQYNMT